MVSEPLLWPFLSSLVFISVTSFFNNASAITIAAAASHRWTSDVIQPSSLGSEPAAAVVKEFHTTLFASPLQILLRLHFWRYYWDRPAPIYTLVEASPQSETARASTRRSKLMFCRSRTTCAPTYRSFFSRATTRRHSPSCTVTRLHAPLRASTSLADVIADVSPNSPLADVTCLRQPLTSSSNSGFDRWLFRLTVDFDWPLTIDFFKELTFSVQVLLTQFFT